MPSKLKRLSKTEVTAIRCYVEATDPVVAKNRAKYKSLSTQIENLKKQITSLKTQKRECKEIVKQRCPHVWHRFTHYLSSCAICNDENDDHSGYKKVKKHNAQMLKKMNKSSDTSDISPQKKDKT